MIKTSVYRIIDAIDPSKILCDECDNYKDIALFSDARHMYDVCVDCYNEELMVIAKVQKKYELVIGSNADIEKGDLDEKAFELERIVNDGGIFRAHIEDPDNDSEILDFLTWLKTAHGWEIRSATCTIPTKEEVHGFVEGYKNRKE